MQSRAAVYSISAARTIAATSDILHIGLPKIAWVNPVITSGIFLLLSLFLMFQGGDSILFGAVGLALASTIAYTNPLKADLILDYRACQVQFSARYALHIPMKLDGAWNFSQVVSAERKTKGMYQKRVSVLMADGNRFVLDFAKMDEAVQFLQRVENLNRPAVLDPAVETSEPAAALAVEQAQISETQALLQREVRSWSIWLFIIGGFQMLAAKGFSSWGALLILMGLASLYYREAPMFIVFAATVIWAGISNVLSGQGQWIVYAAVQAVIGFQLVQQFRRFNKLQNEPGEGQPPSRAREHFPWLSLGLGGGGLLGYAIIFVLIIVFTMLQVNQQFEIAENYALSFMMYAGILGIATGIASLASRYPKKPAAIIGCIAGALVVIIHLIFSFM